MEKNTSAGPKGPIALDVDLRPVVSMMGQMGMGAGGLASLPVKNASIEEGWSERVAQSQQKQEEKRRQQQKQHDDQSSKMDLSD